MNVRTSALRALGIAAALGVAYACRPVTLCGCTPVVPTPAVDGKVVSATGASTAGADVSATTFRSDCGVGNPFGLVYQSTAGNDGRFSLPFAVPPQTDAETFCLRLAVTPAGAGAQVTARDTVIRFTDLYMNHGVEIEIVVP